MLLRRKITLFFMVTMGLLAYGIFDWNTTALFSIHLSSSWVAHLDGHNYHNYRGNLKLSNRHEKLHFENQSSPQDHRTASGSVIGSRDLALRDAVSSEKSKVVNSVEEDDNEQEVDVEMESQINDVVNVISKIARIKVGSYITTLMRKALRRLSSVPTLPRDLAKKSEGGLLSTVVPPAARVVYSDTWQGYSLPVITCTPLGRLGNIMGEYATMFALRKLYNVSVVVHARMRERLSCFPQLSLPALPGLYTKEEWKPVARSGSLYNYALVELAASGLFGPRRFVMKEYAFEIQLFQRFKKELKQEFSFSEAITKQVENFFRGIKERRGSSKDMVFVGFHVRRTDYQKHAQRMFGATLPGDSYFDRAMAHFRHKFPGKVLFIASSDNFTFIQEKLGKHPDVLFSPGTTAPLDMAVLSSCNHSIVTLGSYGFWTGFLAGGEVLYPDVKFEKKEYRFSRAMYKKIGLPSFVPLPVD